MSAAASPAPPRPLVWLVAVSLLFLLGAVLVLLFDHGMGREPNAGAEAGPTARSTSALGYGALVKMLEALHVPVVVSRYQITPEQRYSALLVALEPRSDHGAKPDLNGLRTAPAALVIVPKWNWTADSDRPRWIHTAKLLPVEKAMKDVQPLLPGATLVRPGGAVEWGASDLAPAPTLEQPQLIASSALVPVIAGSDGILLGKLTRDGRTLWVLSDPDLLSNHGIGQGRNAEVAAAIFDRLRPQDGLIFFDEAIQGLVKTTNAWRSFLEVPLVGVTLVFVAAAGLLGWAAFSRYGTPIAEEPPIARGASALIESTTDLLRRHGRTSEMLTRYAGAVFREAAAAIAGPHRASQPDIALILDEAARRHGLQSYRTLRDETGRLAGDPKASPLAAVKCATQLHQWKEELLHGSSRR